MARGRRLQKSWIGISSSSPVALSTTQGLIVSVTLGEGTKSSVLLRSRGNLLISAVPDAASDADMAAFGLIVVQQRAEIAGAGSLPGPFEDDGADWLWHQYVPLDANPDTAAASNSIGTNVRVEVDSKAMRRIPTDHAVVLMGELGFGNFASVSVMGAVRFLFGD